jgi:hypothetical protein
MKLLCEELIVNFHEYLKNNIIYIKVWASIESIYQFINNYAKIATCIKVNFLYQSSTI